MSIFDKKTQKDTQATIIGAGIVGATAALTIAELGLNVTLIEKNDPPSAKLKKIEKAHSAALMGNSLDVLKRTGIWEEIKEFCSPLKTLQIMDAAQRESFTVPFHAKEIGKEVFGYNVPNEIALRALIRKIKKTKAINYKPNTAITGIDFEASHNLIHFEDGKTLKTQLILAADGRNSYARKLAGINVIRKEYKQNALTFIVQHSKHHDFTSTEIQRPGGVLTFVPLPDCHHSSIVFIDHEGKVADYERFKKEELRQKVQDLSRGILGTVEITSAVQNWPIMTLKAKSYKGHRMALIGETAHVLSPLGAQGLNLSLRDIDTIEKLLKEAQYTGHDFGSDTLLQSYQRKRQIDIAKRFYSVDHLNSMVRDLHPLAHKFRRFGLQAVSKIIPLKKIIMREGMAA